MCPQICGTYKVIKVSSDSSAQCKRAQCTFPGLPHTCHKDDYIMIRVRRLSAYIGPQKCKTSRSVGGWTDGWMDGWLKSYNKIKEIG